MPLFNHSFNLYRIEFFWSFTFTQFTEQFSILKKSGVFLWNMFKEVWFQKRRERQRTCFKCIKNTRDKGIDLFQSIWMTSFMISSAHQGGNISSYHCCSLLLLIMCILIMPWLQYLTPVISTRWQYSYM